MEQGRKAARARLFMLMVLQLAVSGAWAPKLFPYMTGLGFSAEQQALVGSSWGIAALVALFFSNQFSDRTFAGERFFAMSHALSGLCLLGVAFSSAFAPFFACYLAYSLIHVSTLSVSNALNFANLAHPARDFGSVRMGGTLGWMLASWPFVFLLGMHAMLEQTRWIFIVAALISFVLAGYALTLPHTPPGRGEGVDRLAWRAAFGLLKKPFVAVLFTVTFLASVIHNGYFVVADAFLADRMGIAGNLSMVVLGAVLVRLGWRAMMIVGVLGHATRFLVFAFAAESVDTIVAVQLLHGVCYAFFFATFYIFVDHAFPDDLRTSAQGLFNLLILGLGMVVASVLFPALVAHFTSVSGGESVVDYRSLFMVPVALSALSALLLAFAFCPPTRGQVGPVGY